MGNEISDDALNAIQPLVVRLKSVGNPDHGQDPDRPMYGVPSLRKNVSSLSEASAVCHAYISEHDLGGGNWAGGQVFDASGKQIARVSYNGRVWAEEMEPPPAQRVARPAA